MTDATNQPKPTQTTREVYGLKYEPDRFNDLNLARSAAARRKAGVVMLGDDEKFWVVCLADAARLERAGIEWA